MDAPRDVLVVTKYQRSFPGSLPAPHTGPGVDGGTGEGVGFPGHRPVGPEGPGQGTHRHPEGSHQEGAGQLAPLQLVEGGTTKDFINIAADQQVVISWNTKCRVSG